ncbi:uncharacterized protein LOC141655741 [Silene latifolia]|uniref:uncharacterized protein LOC141655741 n=1 Tax=Silene latifolia TaxID=37657 RepID=UPI003D783E47
MSQVDVTCPVCLNDVESCLHVAGGCGYTAGVWEGLGMALRPVWGYENAREWVGDVLEELDGEEVEVFITGVWAIWEMRNKVVFENKGARVEDVVMRVKGIMGELENVENGGEKREVAVPGSFRGREHGVRDRRMVPGEVCISVDAGVKEGEGMGLGAICRDEKGSLLWAWEGRRREEFEARVAEAEAVLMALRQAKRMKHSSVRVESDCKTVIEALQCRQSGRSDFHMVISNILSLCRGFTSVAWSYIRRTYNRAAHMLAHSCIVGDSRFIDGGSIPRHIAEVATTDLSMRI